MGSFRPELFFWMLRLVLHNKACDTQNYNHVIKRFFCKRYYLICQRIAFR
jgi:hypothetical protein